MMKDQDLAKNINSTLYPNRWIAVVRGRVVGVGLTAQQAHRAARQTRPKDKPQLFLSMPPEKLRKETSTNRDKLTK
ncbi:MAG: hypothetical protein JW953_03005 [Anaerolineae bacterium]|nr:hypothetical protein [Anaerolineae bacterium]